MTASKAPIEVTEQNHLRTCKRCGLVYDWRRSPSSSLKMTYCGSLCEHADLGFTLEALLRMPAVERAESPAPANPVG
jgi:hypothetical protein